MSPSSRFEAWLWLVQRLSAMVLAAAVAVHLGTVIYAVRGGLRAADILQRVNGSTLWPLFYGAFVIAVALHAPIGLRTVVRELTRWRGRSLDWTMLAVGAALAGLGFRAVLGLLR